MRIVNILALAGFTLAFSALATPPPCIPEPITITVNDSINQSVLIPERCLAPDGKPADLYEVTFEKKTSVALTLRALEPAFTSPRLDFMTPDGKLIASATARRAADTVATVDPGTYLVAIRSQDAQASGRYAVALHSQQTYYLNSEQPRLQCGSTLTANLTDHEPTFDGRPDWQFRAFTIWGKAGSSLRVSSEGSGFHPTLSLRSGYNGRTYASGRTRDQGAELTYTFESTGVHSIFVSPSEPRRTGVLSLNVSCESPEQVVPLVVSQPQSVSLIRGETVKFSVEVDASEPVTYRWIDQTDYAIRFAGETATIEAKPMFSGGFYVYVHSGSNWVASNVASVKIIPRPRRTVRGY